MWWFLGCAQELEGFGKVGDSWVVVGCTGEDGTLGAVGAVVSRQRECLDAPAEGGWGLGGGDGCEDLVAVFGGSSCSATVASKRSAALSFTFEAVDDPFDLQGQTSDEIVEAPCYGANTGAPDDEPVDGAVTVVSDDGAEIVLSFEGATSGTLSVPVCR